jgi:hypothetical protein
VRTAHEDWGTTLTNKEIKALIGKLEVIAVSFSCLETAGRVLEL